MPEVTEEKIRIPVSDCKITATIDISAKDGISALYCGKEKQIATYLFDTEKWTMAEAKEWIEEHAKSLTKAIEKAKHRRDKCMDCNKPPTVEILWAEGMAHAWFCDEHFEAWKQKDKEESKKTGFGSELSSERKLSRGLASLHWKDGVPTKAEVEEYFKAIEKSAIPYKKTPLASETETWEAAREVASAEVDDLKIMCAIVEGDPENKGSYKLPHHKAGGEHACVWPAVANCAAVLMGARGGVKASPESIAGAKRHIASHYQDFEKGEPPWLRKEDKAEKSWQVPILKSEEERFVYGIVLQPDIVDAQGDTVNKEEIAKAAHSFMENCQKIGVQHNKIVPQVKIWESYLAPQDMTIAGQPVVKGSWVLGVHVLDDEVWGQVKKNELTGFSIKGYANTRGE